MPHHYIKAIVIAVSLGLLVLPNQILAQDMETDAVRKNLRPNLSDDHGTRDYQPGGGAYPDTSGIPAPGLEDEVGGSEEAAADE